MSGHTPGPWAANNIPNAPEESFHFATAVWVDRTDEGGKCVLICSVAPESFKEWQPSKEEQTANAILIAAAPALLEVCERALDRFKHAKAAFLPSWVGDDKTIAMLEAAIAQAKVVE